MMHRLFVVVSIVTAAFCQSADAGQSKRRPNIILIMADDAGCDWFGCYGASHKTPNIDRLAKNGIRFQTAWATPICTPTRHQLLTGRYPFRTGWIRHHDVPRWGRGYFDWTREVTFARLLRMAGYVTAIGGKWQINDFRKQKVALSQHGFREHCVWTGYETGNPQSGERYWNPYLQINGERSIHKGKFGPKVINDFLIDFMTRHKERPFLVYYPMLLAHGPFIPTPDNKVAPPKSKQARYAGMVTYLDKLVGNIVAAVEKLGLAENTIIIFTCDNGSSVAGSRFDMMWPRGKGRLTNIGAQVPFVVQAPMLGKGGRVCDDLIDFSDVLPTMVELAGARMPDNMKTIDGRSFVGSLTGKGSPASKRKWIYAQLGDGRLIRDKTYLLNSKGGFWIIAIDPMQKIDLSKSKDAEVVAARDRLQRALQALPNNAPLPFVNFGKGTKKKKKKRK